MRSSSSAAMCRYAHVTYKPHFACFSCRKAFKRRLLQDVDPEGEDQPARCPQCGEPMAEMGLDFAAPPRTKVKQWAVLRSLWEAGQTFHSCGCGGPGYRPRDARALVDYLRGVAKRYRAQIDAWKAETDPRRQRFVEEAMATWQRRVERVEATLARLG